MILTQLAGNWTIDRTISNGATMQGQACFEKMTNEVFSYQENGVLILNSGQKFSAYREYIYAETADGFDIYFDRAQTNIFHSVTLLPDEMCVWIGHAHHVCKHDIYQGLYRFSKDGSFAIDYIITGPQKNMQIHTTYTPFPPTPIALGSSQAFKTITP